MTSPRARVGSVRTHHRHQRRRHPRRHHRASTRVVARALTVEELKLSPTSSSRANAAIGELGRASASAPATPAPSVPAWATTRNAAVVGGALAAAVAVKYVFDTPSRTYVDGENTVGKEYDAWTEEGILEYYWGEHIHLGWYSDEELAEGAGTLLGCKKKDFIQAKFDFVDEMAKWS